MTHQTFEAMDDDSSLSGIVPNMSRNDHRGVNLHSEPPQFILPSQNFIRAARSSNIAIPAGTHIDFDCAEALMDLLAREQTYGQMPDYLHSVQNNGDFEEWMRSKVAEWAFDVCDDWKFSGQTAVTAVMNFDRFMIRRPVSKRRVQLIACAAISTAAKMFEREAPLLDELAIATMNTFSVDEIRQMEMVFCQTLDWKLRVVTATDVLAHLFKAFPPNCSASNTATYETLWQQSEFFVAMAFDEYGFLCRYLPSEIALASCALAFERLQFNPPAWFECAKCLNPRWEQVAKAKDQLSQFYDAHYAGNNTQTTQNNTSSTKERESNPSPTNVTDQDVFGAQQHQQSDIVMQG